MTAAGPDMGSSRIVTLATRYENAGILGIVRIDD
jgi:hypothetical protein